MNVNAGAKLSIGALTMNVPSTTGVPAANPAVNLTTAGSQLQLTADVLVNGGIGAHAAINGTGATTNQLLIGSRTFNVLSAGPSSTSWTST